MASAEGSGSVRSAVRSAVVDYYQGHDLSTAQAIRRAQTDTEAAEMMTAIRQGRLLEVLLVGGSAALGAIAGALAQRAVGNFAIKGVPVAAPVGAAPAVAGMVLPLSLSGRSMLTAGGLSFSAGAAVYRMVAPSGEESP